VLSAEVLMFCRWSIGLTFAVSAFGKARELRAFELAVVDLAGVPAGRARPVALATLLAEVLVVLAVAVGGPALPVGFGLAAGLLLLFSFVLARALRRRTAVSCNCFGASERPISGYDLVRNGALLACCVAGLALVDRPAPAAAVIVLLALMAGCFMLIVTNAEDIVDLLRKPYLVE
jgi:hypothetical protein